MNTKSIQIAAALSLLTLLASMTIRPGSALASVQDDIGVLLAAEPTVRDEEWALINDEKIVVRDNSFGLPGGQAMTYVRLPPEKVFSVITAYGRYMEFMPGILKLDVRRDNGDESQVYAQYHSQWPFADVEIESINIKDPVRMRMAWKAVQTNFKTAQGSWVIKPHKQGTLIIYQMGFDLNWVPQAFARTTGKKRVETILAAVVDRAKAL